MAGYDDAFLPQAPGPVAKAGLRMAGYDDHFRAFPVERSAKAGLQMDGYDDRRASNGHRSNAYK